MFPVSDLEDLYCRYTNNTVFVLDTADTCGVSEASTLRLLCSAYPHFSVHVCPMCTRISQYTCVRGTHFPSTRISAVSTSSLIRMSEVHAYLPVQVCPGYTGYTFSKYTYVRGKHVSLIHVCPEGTTVCPVHVCPGNTYFTITRVSVVRSFRHYTCIQRLHVFPQHTCERYTCFSRAYLCPWYERFPNTRVSGGYKCFLSRCTSEKHAFREHACVRGTPTFERVI
jgi:hypothetical protein